MHSSVHRKSEKKKIKWVKEAQKQIMFYRIKKILIVNLFWWKSAKNGCFKWFSLQSLFFALAEPENSVKI